MKELPAHVVMETSNILVIKDIAPKAPVHYLMITKKHINDLASVSRQDVRLLDDIVCVTQELARTLPGSQSFQIISNNGHDAGQTVFHLHFHFISGKNIFTL